MECVGTPRILERCGERCHRLPGPLQVKEGEQRAQERQRAVDRLTHQLDAAAADAQVPFPPHPPARLPQLFTLQEASFGVEGASV